MILKQSNDINLALLRLLQLKILNSKKMNWPPPHPLDKMAAISQTVFSDAFSLITFLLYFDENFAEVCS